MASSSAMEKIMEAAIGRLEPGPLSDSALQGLRYILPDTLILGALTLIDRECVVRYTLENGRQLYVVQGSSAASYSVYPKLGASRPPFCSCYAFLHGVLSTRMHLLCKHLLAVRIAIQMKRIIERNTTEEDFARIIKAQVSPSA